MCKGLYRIFTINEKKIIFQLRRRYLTFWLSNWRFTIRCHSKSKWHGLLSTVWKTEKLLCMTSPRSLAHFVNKCRRYPIWRQITFELFNFANHPFNSVYLTLVDRILYICKYMTCGVYWFSWSNLVSLQFTPSFGSLVNAYLFTNRIDTSATCSFWSSAAPT